MTLQKSTRAAIADEVRGLLAKKRISHTDFARALSLSKMAASRRLNGDVSFSGEELLTASEVLDVPIHEVYGLPAPMPAPADPTPPVGSAGAFLR